MTELERLRRVYAAIDEPSQETIATARELLLAEISSDLANLAGNGRPRLEPSHGRQVNRRRRWGLVALAAVILVGALLVAPALGIGQRLLELIQGDTVPPGVQRPSWSPDGRQIAFLGRRGRGNWELYVMNADGSARRMLMRIAAASAPAWSPDRKIVFEGPRERDASHKGLFVVNADGSGLLRLAPRGYSPAWSPDGRMIAFAEGARIHVVNSDGSARRDVTPRPTASWGFASLGWSPDGRRIAFLGPRGIAVVNADGSGMRRLAHNGAAPVWSPDGRKLAFVRDPYANSAVWMMNADGSGKRRLTRATEQIRALTWSRDGRRILFASEIAGAPYTGSEVYVMNADGSGRRNLTRNPAHDFAPSWSPDGRKIVFVSDRDGKFAVYVMNADGSAVRKLARPGG